MFTINKFIIHGLWTEKDIELDFENNRLILVGENGSGKTTVLRILYAFLSSRIDILKKENFKSIELHYNNTTIKKLKEEIDKLEDAVIKIDSEFIKKIPMSIRRRLIGIFPPTQEGKPIKFEQFANILDEYFNDRDKDIILDYIDRSEYNILGLEIDNIINYFPTYRLFEKELYDYDKYILNDNYTNYYFMEDKLSKGKKSMEIIENGMHRLEKYINDYMIKIKIKADDSATKLNYQSFKGILRKEHIDSKDKDINIDEMEKVFNSVNADILSDNEKNDIKEKLKNIIEQNKDKNQYNSNEYDSIVIYFYNKLYDRYKEIKNDEKDILGYFEICNKYLKNKELVYMEEEFRYKIIVDNKEDVEITLSDLSSGEKQIILIFAYLYLLNDKDKIVFIIDEPELSLSIEWQKQFLLDISNSPKCAGLIAATHSPFIFENDLDKYVYYLGDFIKDS